MKHLILILSLALLSVACDDSTDKKDISPDDPKKTQAVLDKYRVNSLTDSDYVWGDNVLADAIYDKDFESVKILVNAGADVNAPNNFGWMSLHVASRSSWYNHLITVKYLVENGANVNAKTNDGEIPLHLASEYNNLAIVKYFVENGADVNASDNDGKTPLHLASEYNNLAIVKYLVENGADVNASDNDGDTPLSMSKNFFFFDTETTDYLKSIGAR